jgi:hypothetical protein
VRYEDAIRAVALAEIPLEWRLAETGGPFNRNGAVNEGYLYGLSESFRDRFFGGFADRFPRLTDPLLPPEAADSAIDLLRRLLGLEILTISGRTNRVLRIEPPNVIVGTERSPHGEPVPIADVQAALDQLTETGAVVIDPPDVGYRSAFVGAVLLTLPGAQAAGSPPVITIAATPGEGTEERSITFEGDLERPREGIGRGEQARLHRMLFGSAAYAQCDLCGSTFPVRFLHAADVKQRSSCTDEERRDLANVAMSACLFGCDALYEFGFVSVTPEGTIEVSPNDIRDPSLGTHLKRLVGRRCLAATSGRAAYFAWHRANKFRA